MQKYDWKKTDKALYQPGKTPVLIDVPTHRFLVIDGAGNPNGDAFERCVGALYTVYYGIRMLPKQGPAPEGFMAYDRFPLEGIWTATHWDENAPLDKEALVYRLMLRQPDFVTADVFAQARDKAILKKPELPIADVTLEDITDGLSVQLLHIGSYDDEPASFARMDAFARDNGLVRADMAHHREIYLSDPRKGEPAKQRTILRYSVRRA